MSLAISATPSSATPYHLGIRENLTPFLQQLLQVFFVGLTIGLQRTVIPALPGLHESRSAM